VRADQSAYKKLANLYGTGIRPTIVRIIVVVISVVLPLVLSVEVVGVSLGGGGGGATTPGESIIPASAEVASAAVRIVTAHVRRSLFMVLYPPRNNTKIFV
jgi:hypothetical protein